MLAKGRLDRRGMSVVEVIVSLMVFSMGVLAVTSAGVISGSHLRASRSDVQAWAAVHRKLDELTALGYDQVSSGAGTVNGYALEWEVEDGDPKKIILTILIPDRHGVASPDTFITYLAEWER